MRVSAKSRHAVAALVDLGMKSMHRPVALVDILDDQDISLSYLEQIFSRLKDHGLVEGVRGPRGGYRLSRSAGDISVAQIVAAVEDRSFRGRKSRITGQPSEAHRIWDGLSSEIMGFLDGITVGDLLQQARQSGLEPAGARRYYEPPRRRAA
ncbi:MAG: Rrf2 family transcriptional regulator [Gammaproteobacteria bacterium]|jgi:Rrf2 family iron-sulfur cluster assembly transcriptional regulator|nr:Rrf2 family transcriptional regulator [Desulfobacterales bacterium]MCU0937496.1 Rrf2 family transcriptional regulator [Gammaproteobacteria bacterium]